MKTLNTAQCLEILNCEKSKFMMLVNDGEIPGAKIGRSWIFLEEDIYEYLKNEIGKQQKNLQMRKRIRLDKNKTQS